MDGEMGVRTLAVATVCCQSVKSLFFAGGRKYVREMKA